MLGKLLYLLNFIPVFSSYLVAGNTFLLEFIYNVPAHPFGKAPAFQPLHRYIRVIFLGVVKLPGRRNTIKAKGTVLFFCGFIGGIGIVWENTRL